MWLLFCTVFLPAHAQRERAMQWAFPHQNRIDFSSGTLVNGTSVVPSSSGFETQNTSTICDLNGNLVAYSNGMSVWNASHNVMTNGTGLVGSNQFLTTQSSIIVPYPGFPDRYWLFALSTPEGAGLHHYMLEMAFAGGLVVDFGQLDTFMCGKLAATKHANDIDYWVVAHKFHTDTFVAYKVSSDGVSSPVYSKVGEEHLGNLNAAAGQMKISPDGTKIALAGWVGGFVQIFCFNNETGEVTQPLTLVGYASNFPQGVEFSPDSRKIYYSQRYSGFPQAAIYQFDLDHLDTACILDSKTSIGILDSAGIIFPSSMQLGVDGRIYIGMKNLDGPQYDTLAVINKPNLLGSAADLNVLGYETENPIKEGLTTVVSSFVSDGIHVVFGTTCEDMETVMFPEDTLVPDSVRWDFGDPASGANNTSILMETSHIFTSADTFSVTLYAFRGAITDTFYRDVVIWDTAINHVGNDTTVCPSGGPAVLDGTWHNACLYWSTGASSNTIAVAQEGWYWVDVYYQSCYFRDSVYVEEVDGPPTFDLGNDTSVCNVFNFIIDPDLPNAYYTWQDGSHDTTYTVTQTGTYILSATNACGTTVDQLTVIVNVTAQPVLTFPDDTTLCDTSRWVVDVTFDDATYLWSTGSQAATLDITDSGQYWVRVSNICDTVSDTVSVFIDPVRIADMPARELLCTESGDTVRLYASAQKPEALWSDSSLTSEFVVTQKGRYWATVSNACGTTSDTTEVVLWDTAYPFSLGPDTMLCDSAQTFELGWKDSLFPFTYVWENGQTTPFVTATPGVYGLTISNRCAVLFDYRHMQVARKIFIEPLNDSNICQNEVFELRLMNPTGAAIAWSTGEKTAIISVDKSGTYSVEAMDTTGCVFVDTLTLGEDCPARVFVPNVFTPNGDEKNDAFCFEFENVRSSETAIFDRWGKEMFRSNEIETHCWDGQYNGKPAPDGVYFYTVSVHDIHGKQTAFNGSLSLFR